MIIALSGVSCTGKDTLINMLTAAGFPVITPSASNLASGRYFPSMEAKDRFIYETGHQQLIDARRISEATSKAVFLNRSQFDNWTFRCVFGGDLSYERLFLEDIKVPDFTWILDPADVPFVSNGIRPEDTKKRLEWHDLMVEKAEERHLEWELLSGSSKARFHTICSRL